MPKQITTKDFIVKANKIHNNFYDYTQVVYTSMLIKVKIIDPAYGEFWQTPMGHLQGQGHPAGRYIKMANKRRRPIDKFIEEAIKLHGDLYDYSKVYLDYKTVDTKVCIVDPEYGEFWQSPFQHLNSHGCPARTADKKWLIHIDHIIPRSIIHSPHRNLTNWVKDRPLYKFINSDINLREVPAKFNSDKSDYVIINNKRVAATTVRNNYNIIAYLIKTELNIDPTNIIEQDKQYVNNYFGIN